MGYTVTSTTAPTIASSDEDVAATINGSLRAAHAHRQRPAGSGR